MKPITVRRARVALFGAAIAIACTTGLPLVAGAVGLDSPVGSCSQVGSNSEVVCLSAVGLPAGAPSTGAGGASHGTDGNLLAGGGLALAGAAAATGLALSRRSSRRSTSE